MKPFGYTERGRGRWASGGSSASRSFGDGAHVLTEGSDSTFWSARTELNDSTFWSRNKRFDVLELLQLAVGHLSDSCLSLVEIVERPLQPRMCPALAVSRLAASVRGSAAHQFVDLC